MKYLNNISSILRKCICHTNSVVQYYLNTVKQINTQPGDEEANRKEQTKKKNEEQVTRSAWHTEKKNYIMSNKVRWTQKKKRSGELLDF